MLDDRMCRDHLQPLIGYCETCEEAICNQCTVYGPHNSQVDLSHKGSLDPGHRRGLQQQEHQAGVSSDRQTKREKVADRSEVVKTR